MVIYDIIFLFVFIMIRFLKLMWVFEIWYRNTWQFIIGYKLFLFFYDDQFEFRFEVGDEIAFFSIIRFNKNFMSKSRFFVSSKISIVCEVFQVFLGFNLFVVWDGLNLIIVFIIGNFFLVFMLIMIEVVFVVIRIFYCNIL